uniref:Tegument serine/threonine protein kinase n=1 Tax=Mastomys natalensis cytomegalovirus 1 TaxID=2973541 RepID=A0A9Y1IKZ2_9BETA|nr:tegument serine/threonine protein kinase [Mastomys natalensis cytomegalovirus 1]
METTPDRYLGSGIPAAPKKAQRRRASIDVSDVLCKVRRKLVFDSKDSEINDMPNVDMSGSDTCITEQFESYVHACDCTPESKHLVSCELVPVNNSISVAKCQLCTSIDDPDECVPEQIVSTQSYSSWSDDDVIVSPFPELKCYVATFANMKGPVLLEDEDDMYLPVYAPYRDTFCQTRCTQRAEGSESVLLGKGSFGHVWKLPDKCTALKIAGDSTEETLLTVWISGVIRTKARAAGFVGELGDSVYRNILIATGSCLQHNLVSFAAFQHDLYTYRGWDFRGLASYQRAFKGLADGYRFLNLHCGIGHFDVTPMNTLVNVDPDDSAQILQAVICDFSLSQFCNDKKQQCVVVFEETKTVRSLQKSTYYLTDLYHPAFKPLFLQKLCAINPRMQFPNPSRKRFCVSDLCALGNVLVFCLARVFDERGQVKVRATSEDALFSVARKACEALGKHDIDSTANYCSLLITRQLAYAVSVLGTDSAQDAITRLCTFFVKNTDEEAPERFRNVYKKARCEIDGSYMIRFIQAALQTPHGRYLIENVRATCLAVDSEELDIDPFSIFP